MIPLGLKETKEVDFFEQFSDFILEHYSVDPSNFEDAILDLIDTRQVRRLRERKILGVDTQINNKFKLTSFKPKVVFFIMLENLQSYSLIDNSVLIDTLIFTVSQAY